jgi:hypothetical protein
MIAHGSRLCSFKPVKEPVNWGYFMILIVKPRMPVSFYLEGGVSEQD